MPRKSKLFDVLDAGIASSSGAPSVLAMRDAISDQELKMVATATCAKYGIDLQKIVHNKNQLDARNEARRSISKLRSVPFENRSEEEIDDVLNTISYLGIFCLAGSRQDELDAEAARVWGRKPAGVSDNNTGTIRDSTGNRIGVMLTAADLRDEGRIAAKLDKGESRSAGILDGDEEPPTLADFFRGVAGMKTSGKVRASLTEGTNTQGGYAVPTILMPGILNALVPASSLLNAGANVIMLDESQAKSFNIAATDTIPTAAWRSENGAVAESDPAFRGITITPQSLAFLFKVSRELLMDAPGIEQALRTAIAQAFAKELDRAGLIGTGTAPEIRGLANMTGINTVSTGANGAVLANYSPFIQARRAIADQNAPTPNAVILSTREDESIAMLADTLGQPLRRPDVLADWRFLTTTQIPIDDTVGTSTDCGTAYVGDFTGFGFYIREGVNVQLLRELYAGTGQVGFVCHTRVDVAAAYTKAFAVIQGLRAAA